MSTTDQWGDPECTAFAWEFGVAVPDTAAQSETMEAGFQLLQDWYTCTGQTDVDLEQCRTARFICTDSVTGLRSAYPHNKVVRGCVLSIVCRLYRAGSTLISASTMGEERCEVRYYAVYEILRASYGDNWCVVKEMTRTRSGYSVSGSKL